MAIEILSFDGGGSFDENDSARGSGGGGGVVTVFLHGFPGIRSRQNRDIAEQVALLTGHRVKVLLYGGLGHAPGIFTFRSCLDDVSSCVDDLLKDLSREGGRPKIQLVGHSWGGFLALVMASRRTDRVSKMVLMSPLLGFASEDQALSAFKNIAGDHPELCLGDTAELSRDFAQVGTEYPPERLVASLPETIDILFLQAKEDPITLTPIAEQVVQKFRRRPDFRLVDQDHSFLVDRPTLAAKIAAYLSK